MYVLFIPLHDEQHYKSKLWQLCLHTVQHFSLYVGTDKNCILEGSLQHKFSYIMWGHVGQVLAIAPHPSDTATFATGGANDRMVVKWRKQRVAWKLEIQSAICSLSWHTNGKVVVAGTEEGNLMALNGESGWLTTGVAKRVLSRLGEFCYCCSLPLLPQLA